MRSYVAPDSDPAYFHRSTQHTRLRIGMRSYVAPDSDPAYFNRSYVAADSDPAHF
jgi:hypothetical protein